MIRPLRGYVVRPEAASRVAAPVAEDLSVEERNRIRAANPDSSLCMISESAETHAAARAHLERVINDGTYVPTEDWWIYRIREGGMTQTGVVAEVSIAAYDAGNVLRHEHTVSEVAATVADALEQVGGSAHPVSLVYRHQPRIDDVVKVASGRAPDIYVRHGSRIQEAWRVDDPDSLTDALAGIPVLYIADGHHRSAGAAALAHRNASPPDGSSSYFLAVLFPDDQMHTLTYYRCLHLAHQQPDEVLDGIKQRLEVRPMGFPAANSEPEAGEIWSCIHDEWYVIQLPPAGGRGPTSQLAAARLQHQVLGPLCDVADPRTDPRLTYVPGSLGYDHLAATCAARNGIAFVTRRAAVGDVLAVADAGGVMPPKSTWFTPKIGAGIFLRLADT